MSRNRDEIRKYMEAKKSGASTGNKEMRFDPITQKFVVVERGTSDALPLVQREDLQAFVKAT